MPVGEPDPSKTEDETSRQLERAVAEALRLSEAFGNAAELHDDSPRAVLARTGRSLWRWRVKDFPTQTEDAVAHLLPYANLRELKIARLCLQDLHPGLASELQSAVEELEQAIHDHPQEASTDVQAFASLCLAAEALEVTLWEIWRIAEVRGWDQSGSVAQSQEQPQEERPSEASSPTDWRDVQKRLLELRNGGEVYTSIAKLACALDCSGPTIHKAIKDSGTLKGWQARHIEARKSPRASSLTDSVMDGAEQTREPDPADGLSADDVDTVFARWIQGETPEGRAKLNSMDADQRLQLVALWQDDPDSYYRVFGRKP